MIDVTGNRKEEKKQSHLAKASKSLANISEIKANRGIFSVAVVLL